MKTEPKPIAEPSNKDVALVIAEAERVLSDSQPDEGPPPAGHSPNAGEPAGAASQRPTADSAAGTANEDSDEKLIANAAAWDKVVNAARRVAAPRFDASGSAAVLQLLHDNYSFRVRVASRLRQESNTLERKRVSDMRSTLGLSDADWMQRYAEHYLNVDATKTNGPARAADAADEADDGGLIANAAAWDKVINAGRRVAAPRFDASGSAAVLQFLLDNYAFRVQVASRLREDANARERKRVSDMRSTLGLSDADWMQRYAAHHMKGNAMKTGGPSPRPSQANGHEHEHGTPRTEGPASDAAPQPPQSRTRKTAQSAAGLAGGEAARRAIAHAVDREKVIKVARHVATRKLKDATDAEVLRFIAGNDGFRKSLAGHLHEQFDAEDLKRIYDLRKTLGLSEGRWLKLYAEHNRKGLDGVYKGGARKASDACFAQHKLSENPQQFKKAAAKVDQRVRGKTDLVVPRGVKQKVTPGAAKGLKGVRETGRSVSDIRGIVEKAADPKKVADVGTKAAKNISVKAGAGAAAAGAGISVAFDINKVRKGELSVGEAAENAVWAGGEAAASTVAIAGATVVAAPTMAAGVAVLAGSSVAGTTAMAAGLATLGPIGLGIGVGIGVGCCVKKLRKSTRG